MSFRQGEGQHQSPPELISQNLRSILSAVLNKLENGNINDKIDFARYKVDWLCSVQLMLGGNLHS